MNRYLLSTILALLCSAALYAQNPIIRDQFSADPSALVVGDRVYVFPSHDIPAPDDYARKDWFCMADYHVFSSSDLVHWVDHGVILDQKNVPWGDPKAYSMWAPDCAEHNGKYVFFFPDAARPEGPGGFGGFRCGTAVADSPEGPYTPRKNYIKGVFGIDPCIFKDDDGQGYLVWPSRGIKICKLNDDWSDLDGEMKPIPVDPAIPDSIRRMMPPMMQVEGTVTVGEVPAKGLVEGPYMFKANGHYYVTFPWARENTEVLAYCMADKIDGPYKFMGVFFEEWPNGCWTNHHSIINFKGQWYLFYHHNEYSPKFDKNRSVCADSLFFEKDGSIRLVKPSLRGIGVTPASEPVQMDRYSAISASGAHIEYLDTNDCFKGWKTVLSEKNAWVKYNTVEFDDTSNDYAYIKVQAPRGGTLILTIDGKKAATAKIPAAAGWQTVKTRMKGVKPGIHHITLSSGAGTQVAVDWISFSEVTACMNPLTNTDIPDNDIIRVGDDFYMVSTTMFFCPGAPIMHSKDLVHWRIVNYVYDSLADDDIYNLRDGRNAYGRGQWATSLRYHEGTYYALFSANDQGKTYVYRTDDIVNGKWEQTVLDRHFHDASLLFDTGRVFVVWGNGDLQITELTSDLRGIKEGGIDRLLISSPKEGYMLRAEGSHFYHIGDWYYVLEIDWPAGGHRTESCWRSRTLEGPYEKKVILDGRFDGRGDGVAQGGIVQTQKGDWYAVMFQDHGAVGRIPTLQPVVWKDGWPVLGDDTRPVKSFYVNLPEDGESLVYADDDFEYSANQLSPVWQWNHRPDNALWTVTERPGWLRLKNGHTASGVMDARNTLTQRTAGPACTCEVLLDASGMKAGDHAGLCAFQSHYCRIGITIGKDGKTYLEAVTRHPGRKGFGIGTEDARLESAEEEVVYRAPMQQKHVWLRLEYVFTPENGWKKAVEPFSEGSKWKTRGPDKAYMSFSPDGEVWTEIPVELQMRYTLDYFIGYRTALYSYPTVETGGFADFDRYRIKTTR